MIDYLPVSAAICLVVGHLSWSRLLLLTVQRGCSPAFPKGQDGQQHFRKHRDRQKNPQGPLGRLVAALRPDQRGFAKDSPGVAGLC